MLTSTKIRLSPSSTRCRHRCIKGFSDVLAADAFSKSVLLGHLKSKFTPSRSLVVQWLLSIHCELLPLAGTNLQHLPETQLRTLQFRISQFCFSYFPDSRHFSPEYGVWVETYLFLLRCYGCRLVMIEQLFSILYRFSGWSRTKIIKLNRYIFFKSTAGTVIDFKTIQVLEWKHKKSSDFD